MASLSPAARLALRLRLTVLGSRVRRLKRLERPVVAAGDLDVFYVLDASTSMDLTFPGAASRLEAAKAAILATNVYLATRGGCRATLLWYQGGTSGLGSPPTYATFLEYNVPLSDDYSAIADELDFVGPFGNSPLPHALRFISGEIEAEQSADPSRTPVVMLLTDGVPNISYGDTVNPARGYLFVSDDIEAVPILDGPDFRSIAEVRADGQFYSALNLYAGEPLADTMEAVGALCTATPALRVHALLLGTGATAEGLMQYLADAGSGDYAQPADATALAAAMQAALEG